MKKRVISLLLCIILIVSAIPPVSAASGDFTDTFGGKQYAVQTGYYYAYGRNTSSSPVYLPFYYSDGFFEQSPSVYNAHLATMSLNAAIAATHDGGSDYENHHAPIRQLLSDIGCPESSIYVNADSLVEPTNDSIAFALGSKELAYQNGEKTGYVLVPIAIRGGGYGREWVSNFTLGASGEAQGFSEASDKVYAELQTYLKNNGLSELAASHKVKFWPVGYSRAGAVANLLALRLIEQYGSSLVYAYPWEAPMGGVKAREGSLDLSGIHNCVNYADLVPLVAPSKMGFKRYGVDKVFPSQNAAAYQTEKAAMLRQLALIDPNYHFSDSFPIYGMKQYDYWNLITIIGKLLDGDLSADDIIEEIYTRPDSDTNSPNYFIGEYYRQFLTNLQDWSITSRKKYASEPLVLNGKTYKTIEDVVRTILGAILGGEEDELERIVDELGDLAGEEFSTGDYADLLGLLNDWNSFDEYEQEEYIEYYWDIFHTAFDDNRICDKAYLKKAWPTLVCTLLPALCSDYNTKGSELGYDGKKVAVMTLTMIENASMIAMNHDYFPNLAWARSFDSYYVDRMPGRSTRPVSTAPVPAATVTINGKTVSLSTVEAASTGIIPGQMITLDVPGRSGETIFCKLEDMLSGTTLIERSLYDWKGIQAPTTEDVNRVYKLSLTVNSYGLVTDSVFYFRCTPNCSVSVHSVDDAGLHYNADLKNPIDDEVCVLAALYWNGRMMASAVSEPFIPTEVLESGAGTVSGTLDLPRSSGYTYRVFLIEADTNRPLCSEGVYQIP